MGGRVAVLTIPALGVGLDAGLDGIEDEGDLADVGEGGEEGADASRAGEATEEEPPQRLAGRLLARPAAQWPQEPDLDAIAVDQDALRLLAPFRHGQIDGQVPVDRGPDLVGVRRAGDGRRQGHQDGRETADGAPRATRRCYHPAMRRLVLPALAVVCALAAPPGGARAAETAETLERLRRRDGAWVGAAVVMGRFGLEAPTARIESRLDALPAVAFGVDVWPEETLGLYAGGALGTGATLDLPGDLGALRYSAHQVELGARRRWFLGPRSGAPALFVGLGVRGVRQTVQEQRPALLVDSTVAGPELAAGGELPLAGGRLWLRATARGGVPFFVREAPADSGDPRRFWAVGGRVEAVIRVLGAWSAQASGDLVLQAVEYRGEGTRAAGVEGARTHERFVTVAFAVRHDL